MTMTTASHGRAINERLILCNFFVTDFRRAVTALAIICLIVMVAAIAFTWYSILQPRYIFKRLAGCLQIGCGLFIFSSYLIQSTVYVHYLLCMNASLSSFISLSVWLSVCLSIAFPAASGVSMLLSHLLRTDYRLVSTLAVVERLRTGL